MFVFVCVRVYICVCGLAQNTLQSKNCRMKMFKKFSI